MGANPGVGEFDELGGSWSEHVQTRFRITPFPQPSAVTDIHPRPGSPPDF